MPMIPQFALGALCLVGIFITTRVVRRYPFRRSADGIVTRFSVVIFSPGRIYVTVLCNF